VPEETADLLRSRIMGRSLLEVVCYAVIGEEERTAETGGEDIVAVEVRGEERPDVDDPQRMVTVHIPASVSAKLDEFARESGRPGWHFIHVFATTMLQTLQSLFELLENEDNDQDEDDDLLDDL
jgi:hypothetical protein